MQSFPIIIKLVAKGIPWFIFLEILLRLYLVKWPANWKKPMDLASVDTRWEKEISKQIYS